MIARSRLAPVSIALVACAFGGLSYLAAQDGQMAVFTGELKAAQEIFQGVKAERDQHFDRMNAIQRDLDKAVRHFRSSPGDLAPETETARGEIKEQVLKRIDDELTFRAALVEVVKARREKLAAEVQSILELGQVPPPNLLEAFFGGAMGSALDGAAGGPGGDARPQRPPGGGRPVGPVRPGIDDDGGAEEIE
ncbi:MAG: hypothetical protein HZA54_02640 [Planctomycetes bacterium]|nr:hypothetical protein [Planctomycetota bacterium]